ncbi:MAG: hypothetical protein SF028_13380 [Candidatus Sumerlaeia bacterium]|nr:hypothetical protein [Candidatus Sumerlaeia bacterium]
MSTVRYAAALAAATLMASALPAQILFQTGFEAIDRDGRYTTGNLNGQPTQNPDGTTNVSGPFWTTQAGDAVVEADGPTRVVRMSNGARVDRSLANLSVPAGRKVFVEGFFRGAGSGVTLANANYPTVSGGGAATSAIIHFSSANGMEALDGDGSGAGTVTSLSQPLGTPNQDTYFRITLELDYTAQTYNVYVDGVKKNSSALGFRDNVTSLSGTQWLAETELRADRFRVALPLTGDANGDNQADSGDIVAAMNYMSYDPDTYDPVLVRNVAFQGAQDGGRLVVSTNDIVGLADLITANFPP